MLRNHAENETGKPERGSVPGRLFFNGVIAGGGKDTALPKAERNTFDRFAGRNAPSCFPPVRFPFQMPLVLVRRNAHPTSIRRNARAHFVRRNARAHFVRRNAPPLASRPCVFLFNWQNRRRGYFFRVFFSFRLEKAWMGCILNTILWRGSSVGRATD